MSPDGIDPRPLRDFLHALIGCIFGKITLTQIFSHFLCRYTSCTIYSELFHVHSPARGMGGTPNEAKLTSWPPQPIPSGSLEDPIRGGRQRFSREMGRQSRGGRSMDTPPAAGPQPGRSKQILPRRPLTSTVPGELPQAALTFPLPAIEQPTVDVGIPWPPVRSDQRSGEGGQHARARESHPPTSHPPPLVPGLPMVGSQTNQNVDIRPSVDHPPAPSSGDNALSAYIPSFYTMFPQSSHIHIRSSTFNNINGPLSNTENFGEYLFCHSRHSCSTCNDVLQYSRSRVRLTIVFGSISHLYFAVLLPRYSAPAKRNKP